jgi:pilus assembly protein Flp/PilA
MKKLWRVMTQVMADEEGAALIEYTVLLGIMLVAVIALIVAVGGWVSSQWSSLNAALPAG